MLNNETEELSPLLGKMLARSITVAEIEHVAGGEFVASTVATDVTLTNCVRSFTLDCTAVDGSD